MTILDNCHVRIAFAANDERTAKRISDALGTATELRAQRNYAGHRLAPWLGHVMVSRQETARPLLTPGEVMQLPQHEAIVLVSGLPPIRAKKLRHYEDANFTARLLPPPQLKTAAEPDRLRPRPDDWSGETRAVHLQLATLPFRDLVEETEESGLQPQPSLFDDFPPAERIAPPSEERLLDDDPNAAADRRQMQQAGAGLRRAHAMTRDDDDLVPSF